MSSASSPPPPSLTTIDAMLSLADFIGSPQNLARVKELQKAEAQAKAAQDAAKKETDRAQALLDEHALKVEEHAKAVEQLETEKSELIAAQDILARKLAKMKEAEAI
jgi:hypothetical protein